MAITTETRAREAGLCVLYVLGDTENVHPRVFTARDTTQQQSGYVRGPVFDRLGMEPWLCHSFTM